MANRLLTISRRSFRQPIPASDASLRTINPIRKIFDNISHYNITKDKPLITISVGDPSHYIDPPPSITQAISNLSIASSNNQLNNHIHGYPPSVGLQTARDAICKYLYSDTAPYMTSDDIFLTAGGVHAVDILFYTLANGDNNSDDNILLPKPGWPEYVTICDKYNIKYKCYNLIPNINNGWQIDINHIESIIDKNTKAIVTNNPSNPCGSVFNYSTLLNVLKIANKYQIPIISDEIYSNLIFGGHGDHDKHDDKHDHDDKDDLENQQCQFISYSKIKKENNLTNVPVFIASGMAKNFVVPGWKVGWIACDYDSNNTSHFNYDHDDDKKERLSLNVIENVKKGIGQLEQINFGPSSICQVMLPDILSQQESNNKFWNDINKKLGNQNDLFCKLINNDNDDDKFLSQYFEAIPASGSLYLMVKIKIDEFDENINNDIDFFDKLLCEQAVNVLPGSIFGMDNYFRVVITSPCNVIHEVIDRMKQLCQKYGAQKTQGNLK